MIGFLMGFLKAWTYFHTIGLENVSIHEDYWTMWWLGDRHECFSHLGYNACLTIVGVPIAIAWVTYWYLIFGLIITIVYFFAVWLGPTEIKKKEI